MPRFALALLVLAPLLFAGPLAAQDRQPSHCIAMAEAIPGATYLHKASFRTAPAPDRVRISYIAHASFLIQSAGGVNVVTDYTGFLGVTTLVPDVVTMNHAHATHWTASPDPAIRHVLKGWGPYRQGIEHHLEVGDMLIRNVSTDIRSFDGVEEKGNSIFIFEVAGLCVGHLGHLHHEPNEEQYAGIGRLDVVMAAVDGGRTVDLPTMIRILSRLRSSVVIPMHWFDEWTLDAFLLGMPETFDVIDIGDNSVEVSLRDLPSRPTVVVLRPRFLED
ncbi:MBL fold metallo-hydrolase [Shimia biformata]|uniref:MBL fold metallo-hydrolase n=1 Tax=Shimia biformata TaxID=1294299 RepID=UPI00194F2C92|nr:MBL fold metallo-hydrolase [Shimia biformata]